LKKVKFQLHKTLSYLSRFRSRAYHSTRA